MRKSTRTVTLILAHLGLGLSLIFLVCYMVGQFVPSVHALAHDNFFLFDYFILIIPLLCIVSGILLQVSATHPKRKRPIKPDRK